MRWSPNYFVACRIQDAILDRIGVARQGKPGQVAKTVDPKKAEELKPSELASLAKAWDTLEERKRLLRMKPVPKAVDVTPKEKQRPSASFRE